MDYASLISLSCQLAGIVGAVGNQAVVRISLCGAMWSLSVVFEDLNHIHGQLTWQPIVSSRLYVRHCVSH